jgi:hypothetical protein
VTFYSNEVTGGATAANKSGYTATIIFGSNALGEPLPPHFQLKSTAQTPETQRMSTECSATSTASYVSLDTKNNRKDPARLE